MVWNPRKSSQGYRAGGVLPRGAESAPVSSWRTAAGIKQLADEAAPQVMRSQVRHAGVGGEKLHAHHHRLRGHGALFDVAALLDRAQQRAWPGAAANDPGVDGRLAAGRAVDDALLCCPLPVADGDRADVIVGKLRPPRSCAARSRTAGRAAPSPWRRSGCRRTLRTGGVSRRHRRGGPWAGGRP